VAVEPAETVLMSRRELRGLLAAGLPDRPVDRPRRHASDLTAEMPVVRWAGIEDLAGDAAGRHRAPADSGRHRAGYDRSAASPAAVASGDPGSRPRRGGYGSRAPEPELMTRPIRLGDLAGWPWSATAGAGR
jgi:hypothetical protein